MYVYVFDDCVRKEPAWKQMFFVQFKLESNLSQNDNFFSFSLIRSVLSNF